MRWVVGCQLRLWLPDSDVGMPSILSVLFIAPSAYPLGGVAVWLDYLAPGLLHQGWQATAGLVAGRCHDVAAYRAAYPRLPVVEIHNPTGSAEGRIRAIEATLLKVRPHIVVAVNIVDVYAAARRVRSRGLHLRAVMALHGIAADLLADLQREAALGLDAVIATNRLACKLCQEYAGMPPERVLYAPYGVEAEVLGALPHKPRTGPLRIVWVGRLEQEQKRVHDLPSVLAALDDLGTDYHLRVVGDGPERAAVAEELAPWVQCGRVELTGALPAAALGPKVYAEADALLITSSWETGPIVAWEAMACGVAVVTSRYVGCGLEDALHHKANCRIFPVGDAAQAAQQLNAVAIGDAHRQQLATAGRELVSARYDISRSVAAWVNCLEDVMHLPAQPLPAPEPVMPVSGRLDRLLGVGRAQTVRSALKRRYRHAEAGGEWPHTAALSAEDRLLQATAARLDALSTEDLQDFL